MGKAQAISCMFLLMAGLFVFLFAIAIIVGGDSAANTNNNGGGTYGNTGGDLANADAITEEQLKCLLTKHPNGYNLLPYASQIYTSAHKFNINPLFALAIANKDSSMGTAGAGEQCMNPGNIQNRTDNYSPSGAAAKGDCSTVYGGASRWAAFSNYGDGMQAKMWLLRTEYLDKGLDTVEKIINVYAPSSENDTALYIKQVVDFMNKYASQDNCGGQ